MTANSPKAFFLSAAFHALVIALLLLFTYAINRPPPPVPATFELVAGEGDNYGAHVAPKLGVPNGIKIDVPAPPMPAPAPVPEPVKPERVKAGAAPAPPPPKPQPAPVTKAAEPTTVPNFSRQIRNKIIREESKAKKEIAKERAAEAKRAEEEKKKQQMSKAEFDRLNKSKSSAAKESPAKVARLDAEGIARGVVDGSTENKVGGQGGKALRNDSDDVLAAYFAMFKQRVRDRFEPPPGSSDALKGTFEFRSHADGSISGVRVVKSSGSSEFDQAVLEAIRRVTMPARPDKRSESVQFDFTMRDKDEG